jgi:hypothetical protein
VDDLRKSKHAGKFTLAPREEIYGELTIAGPESTVYLYDRHEFQTHAGLHQYITGILQDLTKVSLIDCLTTLVPGHGARAGEEYYFASVFPDFVVHGDSFLAPDEKRIIKVHFAVDDAPTLFFDFDAFGFLLDSEMDHGKTSESLTCVIRINYLRLDLWRHQISVALRQRGYAHREQTLTCTGRSRTFPSLTPPSRVTPRCAARYSRP